MFFSMRTASVSTMRAMCDLSRRQVSAFPWFLFCAYLARNTTIIWRSIHRRHRFLAFEWVVVIYFCSRLFNWRTSSQRNYALDFINSLMGTLVSFIDMPCENISKSDFNEAFSPMLAKLQDTSKVLGCLCWTVIFADSAPWNNSDALETSIWVPEIVDLRLTGIIGIGFALKKGV